MRRFCSWAGSFAPVLLIFVSPAAEAGPREKEETQAPMFCVTTEPQHARITALGWDTEGGRRAKINLLRTNADAGLWLKIGGRWQSAASFPTSARTHDQETAYRLTTADAEALDFAIRTRGEELRIRVRSAGREGRQIQAAQLRFPFDARVAATTVFTTGWDAEDRLRLPAIISAPDLGQMLLTATAAEKWSGRLIGSRAAHTVDLTLDLPPLSPGKWVELSFTPVVLPTPKGLHDKLLWPAARRGWFNAFQTSAQWGDQGNRFSAPAGILANNVVSDPVSCLLHLWADQALLTPKFSSQVNLSDAVRRTVDWWLEHRTKTNGEVYAYWDHTDMLDANCGPLIAAWDYVEATRDLTWVAQRLSKLELLADYLVSRDVDGDGLIESTHSGNSGTLHEPMRAGSAYDTINAGFKDAYCNTLAYRAFCSLSDLERQLKRPAKAAEYGGKARRLKAAYFKTFFNPETRSLDWWISQDGKRHNLASPMINSMAVCYGLMEVATGKEILNGLWQQMEAAGFKRFDLGVPITLAPVPRADYLMDINCCGAPQREDGTDTFGQYLNGGCLVSDAVYFITALNIVGEHAKADRILRAMLERQARGVFPNGGGFQNGVVDAYPRGAEFYTWDGQTCGYEGHLTYSYSFLQAVLLREPKFRNKLFRVLAE
jgi:hypothetical protein